MRHVGFQVWFGGTLVLGGAAVLTLYCYHSMHAASAQKQAKEWLDAAAVARTVSSRPATPVAKVVHHGDPLGELEIPRLRLSVMVFEGDDPSILKIGAGHIPGTAMPFRSGNIGIAAHRDTFFRPLRGIRPSDEITLRTPYGGSRFMVTQTQIVDPTNDGVLATRVGRDLTLVTCYPFYYIGHAPQRFIVHAKKIE